MSKSWQTQRTAENFPQGFGAESMCVIAKESVKAVKASISLTSTSLSGLSFYQQKASKQKGDQAIPCQEEEEEAVTTLTVAAQEEDEGVTTAADEEAEEEDAEEDAGHQRTVRRWYFLTSSPALSRL